MKILFVGLTAHYTTGLNYQGNSFNKILIKNGYEVAFISDVQYFDSGVLKFGEACDYIDSDGVRLIRVPYLFSNKIGSKFKVFENIYHYIDDIKPDIIYCHSPQYFSVYDIIKYKKNNKNVHVYADTHTGYYNAGIDKWYFSILYRLYYKRLYKSLEPYLDNYFYIGSSDKEFSINVFNANEKIMKFLPLGGEAIDDEVYSTYRNKRRKELGFDDEDIMILHSGKLDEKKNTDWLINTISSINNSRLKLVIIGNIPSNNYRLKNLVDNNSNSNIIYLGWKNSSDLLEYICASDIYAQPGSQSITLNNALCCQTPVISFKHDLYSEFFDINSIYWIKNINDLNDVFNRILSDKLFLLKLKQYAKENKYILDYQTNLFKALNLRSE